MRKAGVNRETEFGAPGGKGRVVMRGPKSTGSAHSRSSSVLTALLDVLLLVTSAPLSDEGTGAHIFQLSNRRAGAHWFLPLRGGLDAARATVRRLAFPAAVVFLASAALFYLEHTFTLRHTDKLDTTAMSEMAILRRLTLVGVRWSP